jgi:predicted PurR-regulated permease PerM
MPQKIEISSKTIIFTIGFVLLLGVIWLIKDLIFSLFIAFIIAGALRQPVDFFEKKKIPRSISSFIVYFLFVCLIASLFGFVIPPLVNEMTHLIKNLPHIIQKTFPSAANYLNLSVIGQNLPNLANRTVDLIRSLFSNIIFVTTTLFFGFYLLIEKNFIGNILPSFFEDSQAKRINLFIERAQKRTASWFWGEVILMTAVGVLTYIGLTIIGMKYALALAVLAGLLEVIPTFGPILSTIPAALIGFSTSYILGLSNIVLYFIVQQLENNLLVPLVMKKIVGIHPIITLIALIIGGKLAGIIGVLIAVPTTIFIETILIENQKLQKK